MRVDYRLGIDIGATSLGWCALRLVRGEPVGILDLGSRIYSDGRDPQKGASLAVDRRVARQMRRRRDRFLRRREDLMAALIRHGLMPADERERRALEALDPYALRKAGLDRRLELHELGRALFHLHQRRGFQSSRKTSKGSEADEKETGRIKGAVTRLRHQMEEAGARTLGEYLADRHAKREGVRARLRGEGAKAEYELYPERAMVKEEFERLWSAQAGFHPGLRPETAEELRCIMFRQRPLKPVEPGKCRFVPEERRAPAALPSAQRFRILQEIANLAIEMPDRSVQRLTREQAAQLFAALDTSKELTFGRIRKLLKLDSSGRFNLEDAKRDRLKGNLTHWLMARPERFGERWWHLAEEEREAVVERLVAETDEEALLAGLREKWQLDEVAAQAVADAPLPDGFSRLGRTALRTLVGILRDEPDPENAAHPIRYPQAVERAGWHHSDFRADNTLRDALPYYGEVLERDVAWGSGDPEDPPEKRYGRIANPTVHIGLNQVRRLVNDLIEAYGPPREIVVELARELKLSREDKERIAKEQAARGKLNDIRRRKLEEQKQPPTPENMLKLRLWEELNPDEPHNRRCVYTNEQIGIERLFSPSVAIDHILPFRDSFDDSAANKIVCMADANRRKGKRSPFDAFGHTPEWPEIQLRADSLPKNKRWRFAPDAMDRLRLRHTDDLPADAVADMELGDGFLARHLVDTQYLSRMTREYLSHVCAHENVYVVPGRLTALLRAKWGLLELLSDRGLKNRGDHRHHALDACVIALTTRRTLQLVATAAGKSGDRMIDDLPEPWDGFRGELERRLRSMVVSVRPDHGTGGKLHEETAYGLVADPTKEGGYNLVSRKPFVGLNENEVARIRDRRLRKLVQDHLADAAASAGGKLTAAVLRQALAEFARNAPREYRDLHRVRLLKAEQDTIPIKDRDGRIYKALSPGENHHVAIFEQPDGRWVPELVTMFDANQRTPPRRRVAHPTARVVMRLHKGDLLKLQPKPDEEERVMRVVRLGARNNVLWLAEHKESGDLQKRHDDDNDPFRWTFVRFSQLRARRARKVGVDVLGRVRDPGPPP